MWGSIITAAVITEVSWPSAGFARIVYAGEWGQITNITLTHEVKFALLSEKYVRKSNNRTNFAFDQLLCNEENQWLTPRLASKLFANILWICLQMNKAPVEWMCAHLTLAYVWLCCISIKHKSITLLNIIVRVFVWAGKEMSLRLDCFRYLK